MNIQTSFKVYQKINCNDNEECSWYLEKFQYMRGKQKEKVNASLSVKALEEDIINDFLDENNLKFSDLVLCLVYRDGAISDSMVTAYLQTHPKVSNNFLYFNKFSFNYKLKYNNTNFSSIFSKQKNKLKPLNMRYVLYEAIKEYYKKKGFSSYASYIKELFNSLGLYPEGAFKALKPYIRTDYILDPDEEHQKKLEQYRKKAEKKRMKNIVSKDDQKVVHQAAFAVNKFEKTEIIDPFLAYIKQYNLNLTTLVLYELVASELISFEETHLKKEDVKKIDSLNYIPPSQLPYKLSYENRFNAMKKERSTITIYLPNNAKLIEKMKGNLGTWIKYFVLKKYNVYPKAQKDGKDVSSVFMSTTKVKHFFQEKV